jgi:hypothetical protein
VNSFSFNPYKTHHTRLPKDKTSQMVDLSEPLIDEELLYIKNNNRDVGSNLIEIIEKQVDLLKRESEEQQKILEISRTSKNKVQIAPVEENKVLTEFISYNPGRVQAIKHVTTNFKPEYMSLEDLQRLKEEHYNKMLHIENEFYEKKRQEKENIDRMNRFADDDNFIKQQELQMKHMETRKITPEELENILQHENNLFNESRKSNKKVNSSPDKSNLTMRMRAKSAKGIKRNQGNENKPLDQTEKKYVRKYLNYMMKKKLNTDSNDDEEDWNKTRIKSLNINGEVNRKDGLPGHLNNDDYSFYYFSIASDTPRSLSLNSKSLSRSRSHSVNRKMTNKNYARNSYKAFNYSKNSFDDKEINYAQSSNKSIKLKKSKSSRNKYLSPKIKSNLAFIKLIFNLLDSQKQGKVSKNLIINNLNLEEDILKELGFSGITEFLNGIHDIPTQEKDFMTENELKAFLLSRSQIGEDFAHSKHSTAQFQKHKKLNHSNSFSNFDNKNIVNDEENNIDKQEDVFRNLDDNFYREDEEDEFPGMKNNRAQLHGSTKERLEKLQQSLSRSSSKNISRNNSFNKSLNKSLKNSLKEKISKKSNSKVTVDYKDYKNFLKKYKSKKEINFTIPKPFEFLKTDYDARKLRKMQEILEERKQKEDEIVNHRFKANELKREIFISQFDNIIEAERANRKYRTERLKEKIIQDMKPFSFYEQDERKHKEKLERRCEAPKFASFKANPVPWTSQVNLYEDILKKMEVMRKARIEQRKIETAKAAKLPPRMEMHEQKKKRETQEMKMMDTIKTVKRSQSFRAKPIPNFSKAHESFMNNLEKKKAIAKPTEPVPFNFHEPKVKYLC